MKNMVKFWMIIAFAAIVGFTFAACDNGTTGNNEIEIEEEEIDNITVTGVTVTPATPTIFIGAYRDFTASVQGTNNPSQAVTWAVEGNLHQETTISSAGRLSVHIDEDALTLVVRATSIHNTSVSGTATVTVTDIPPEDPIGYTIPTGLTATFGQTLSDVTLPADWTWVTPGDLVGTVGLQTHSAIYERQGNYNLITRSVTVDVTQATPSYTIPTGLTATVGQTLSDITLTSGWTWVTASALVGAVGIQTHDATYTPTDTVNFVTVTRQVNITVTESPVDPTGYTIPQGLTAVVGQTLTRVSLPTRWTWVTPSASVGAVGQRTHEARYTRPGNYNPITRNVTVTVREAPVWKMVSAGFNFSLAITTNGELWAWGSNWNGRTGLGTSIGSTLVPTRVGTATNWAYVSAGTSHGLAVTTTGQLFAWGSNANARTGRNTTDGNTLQPTRVGTATNWRYVSAGESHSHAITTTGELFAWGNNAYGRTGRGITIGNTLQPTRVGTASNWASVSAGFRHSLGVTTTGGLLAWGSNIGGATGRNTEVGITDMPTLVWNTTGGWASASAGRISFSLAVRTNGELWSWGYHGNGRTGRGFSGGSVSVVPGRAGTASNWVSVSAGSDYGFAIATTGSLWSWGSNADGRTGRGTTTGNTTSPANLGGNNWASVSTCNSHGLGVRTDGTLWVWGSNADGRTGRGTTTGNTTSPTLHVWN